MKSLLATLLLTLLTAFAHAQTPGGYAALPKDSASQKVTYTGVVQVPGVTKDQLFARAQEWAARNFVDSKAAARVEDKASGALIFHSSFALPGPADTYAFTVAIYTKDGRYKYAIDQVTRTWGVLNGSQWAAGPVESI